jgi:hypothetical protein
MRTANAERSSLIWGVTLWLACASIATAAEPAEYLGAAGGRHQILSSDMPPGMVGQARLAGRPPITGYFQPVSLAGPDGARFSLSQDGQFLSPGERMDAGLLVGHVYRFRITRIPGFEGAELYPTIEVIDRTYPPPGLATRFPIQVQLDQEDLDAALSGRMVTRVILLEDPQTAIPLPQTPETNRPLDIAEHQDALQVADRLGRPVAIVRIGSLLPPRAEALAPQFFFGYPTWAPFPQPEQVPSTDQPPQTQQATQP